MKKSVLFLQLFYLFVNFGPRLRSTTANSSYSTFLIQYYYIHHLYTVSFLTIFLVLSKRNTLPIHESTTTIIYFTTSIHPFIFSLYNFLASSCSLLLYAIICSSKPLAVDHPSDHRSSIIDHLRFVFFPPEFCFLCYFSADFTSLFVYWLVIDGVNCLGLTASPYLFLIVSIILHVIVVQCWFWS